jgi:hypothetical protein
VEAAGQFHRLVRGGIADVRFGYATEVVDWYCNVVAVPAEALAPAPAGKGSQYYTGAL